VRSDEPDVEGIVGKLTQGAADAGFVYVTDVNATHGTLEAIALAKRLQPQVTYGAGLLSNSAQPDLGKKFIAGLRRGPCADALKSAGFGPAP
jgi:molybdate transport system substrate-binding protein